MILTHCRGCRYDELDVVFDLGVQRLSDFYPTPAQRPLSAPLTLVRCQTCSLVQLDYTVTRTELYHHRYGYVSGVNAGIRRNLHEIVTRTVQYHPNPTSWLDIACNDGTLLSYVPHDVVRVGIDPVSKFAAAARGHANLVISDFFHPNHFQGQKFDVITSISVFYDMNDPAWFASRVAQLLAPGGIWVIQQNYLGDMLANASFDNVCHEHLTYFSLRSLEHILHRYNLRIFQVERDPVNGGCIRTFVCSMYDSQYPQQESVQQLRDQETRDLVNTAQPWPEFTRRVSRATTDLAALAGSFGQPIMLYGASTRGAVIWQACHFKPEWIAAAVEVQPDKIGSYYSAVGPVPIISEQEARQRKPPAMLVGPYWHRDMFIQREREYLEGGGKLVFPLPEMEVYGS